MAISKKVRFEIFKRDGFMCQYCGKIPPNVVLEIDHLIAKVDGGTDDLNNLITSCFDCNRGKGKIPLEKLPASLKDNLENIKEQRKQMKLYSKYLEEIAENVENDLREIGHYFFNYFAKSKRSRDRYVFAGGWKASMTRFLQDFNKYKIMEAIDIAYSKTNYRPNFDQTALFRYMCGILHNWRRDGQN